MGVSSPLLAIDLIRTLNQAGETSQLDPEIGQLVAALATAKARHPRASATPAPAMAAGAPGPVRSRRPLVSVSFLDGSR